MGSWRGFPTSDHLGSQYSYNNTSTVYIQFKYSTVQYSVVQVQYSYNTEEYSTYKLQSVANMCQFYEYWFNKTHFFFPNQTGSQKG